MPGRIRLLAAALVGAIVMPVVACGGDDTPKAELGPTEWKASVYETVLREIALDPAREAMPESETPTIHLATADGSGISGEVQVLVISAMKDIADVVITDDVADIMDEDEPDQPVKDDGLLVTVSPLPDQSDQLELQVGLYFSEANEHSVDATLVRIGTDWALTTSVPPS